jgi:N-acetylglucosamine-6-phosphate deacetylase
VTNATATTTLLRNSRIVLPDRIAESASLLIEDGRIARIFDSTTSQLPPVAAVLDLNGLTLFPGFIDVHIHGAVGLDTMEASADGLRRIAEFLARNGVTAWLPTLVPSPPPQYQRSVDAIGELMGEQSWEGGQAGSPAGQPGWDARSVRTAQARGLRSSLARDDQFAPAALNADESSTPGPRTSALPAKEARVLGVHYEGPFVNSEQCGALHREHFRTYRGTTDLDALPTIKNEHAVHMMTLAPEIDGGIELIGELRRRGWIISLGHTRATVEVLERALQAGARHMTHFMNAMTPLHHRAPGPVGWGFLRDEVTCDVIADGIHIDRLILKLILRGKTSERISLISDAIAAAGLGNGEYQVWGETISVSKGRTQNSRGSIAGSVITLLDAVRLMLSLGVAETDVARMASTNPARLLLIDHECGSIEEGRRADLVALDQNRNVRLTIVSGQVAFDVE